MTFLKRHLGISVVLLLSFWAIKPLLSSGFFPIHDDTQVARVFEMGKALRDGMFPVRWVSDLGYGYGYPIFNFYAPLAYYFGGLLTLLGFDALVATKIMMMVGILPSGVFMYLLAKEFWGKVGGVFSGLFYVYAPYHALDIYVRGDVAEFWAYAFIPLMFLGFYRVFNSSKFPPKGDQPLEDKVSAKGGSASGGQSSKLQLEVQNDVWKWIIVGSLGYAGIILSHNLTAMMVTPFVAIVILLYCYIAYKRKKILTIYYLLFTIFLGLALSSFYWIPALLEMKYTNVLSQIGGGADFRDHFVCIPQLWNSLWGFGGSVRGCIDGLSLKIGKLHIVTALSTIFFGLILFVNSHYSNTAPYRSKQTKNTQNILILGLLVGLVLSVFFTLEVSRPIWEIIPQMAFFQYPWRFLIFASFFSSFLAGSVIWFFSTIRIRGVTSQRLGGGRRNPPKWALIASFGVLIFLLIYPNSKLFQPQTLVLKTAENYTNEKTLKWFTSKISDEYIPTNFVKPSSLYGVANDKISILQGEANIIAQSSKTHKIYYLINVKKETKLKINIAYFPAWNVSLDSKKIPYTVSNNGLIVLLPKGRHRLDLEFIQTPIEKIANSMSLISLIVLLIGIIFKIKLHYE